MTEAQWFSSTNPHDMLAFLSEGKPTGLASVLTWIGLRERKVSSRKLQLFACACCRRIWPLLTDERSRKAIETAELYADGLVGRKAFHQAVDGAKAASLQSTRPRVMMGEWLAAAQSRAAEAVACTLDADDPADEAATWGKEAIRSWATQTPGTDAVSPFNIRMPHRHRSPEAAWIAEGIAQCDLLRDLIGNPFHPPMLDAAWRTPQAVCLAQSIVQDRLFGGLPELADTLEQTGCKNHAVLQHCRDKKEHARGCWVLDFVLGKA